MSPPSPVIATDPPAGGGEESREGSALRKQSHEREEAIKVSGFPTIRRLLPPASLIPHHF